MSTTSTMENLVDDHQVGRKRIGRVVQKTCALWIELQQAMNGLRLQAGANPANTSWLLPRFW